MQSSDQVTRALRRVPLFENVPDPYFGEVAERIKLRHYRAGDIVFHEHDAGEGLYLVADGLVRVFLRSNDGHELTLARFGPGEFFGELAVIDEQPRSATAVAAQQADLLVLNRVDFLEYLRLRPEAAVFCLRILARRLRDTDSQLGDATFLTLPGRLAKALLDLGDEYGATAPDGAIQIQLKLSQTELASIVGGSRPTINQLLQRFRRLGWISSDNRSMVILNQDALRRLVR